MYCSDITSVYGEKEECYGIFQECTHVSISVIACDTGKVTNIRSMFSECSNLPEETINKISNKT